MNWIPWLGGGIGIAIILAFFLHMKHQSDMVPDLQHQIKDNQAQIALQIKSLKKSEDLRLQEHNQVMTSINDLNANCENRIAEAKRTSAQIRTITHEVVKLDKNNCPVRSLLDSSKLRDAIGGQNH